MSSVLKEFNLTTNEVSIFTTLAKKGLLSATQIAQATGLNRPYVYYAVDRLLEKGYISTITTNGKKHYQAQPMQSIVALEELKLEQLKQSLKKLEATAHPKEQLTVEVFKGRRVIKNVFKRIVAVTEPSDEVLYLGLNESIMEHVEPIYIRKILRDFKTKSIMERIITEPRGKKLSYAKTAQYRKLPKKLLGNIARIIVKDLVIDLLYERPFYAIFTTNKELATTARSQFEHFWKISKR